MNSLSLLLRVERLVIQGHIPLPTTLTDAAAFLGTFNTASLSRKGTDER